MRSAAQGSSGDVLQNAAKKLAPAAFEKKKKSALLSSGDKDTVGA